MSFSSLLPNRSEHQNPRDPASTKQEQSPQREAEGSWGGHAPQHGGTAVDGLLGDIAEHLLNSSIP
ncbi:hypothetical protein C4D60_Mb04t04280 [Musa balbisiana]|uniref:Uncharacterized protein n=1 Tax=Musa balbisiana TaxID=52838 RepID=A0A4S8K9K1_MUSBA|nr:hypothetical protein C4D60_Mb04t04280 [Musa balbisiana]